MKTLLKLIVVTFTVTGIFFTASVKAQTTAANAFNFNIGVETGISTGNLRISSRFELGGTARLQYGVTNNFAITLTSGAFHNFGRDIPGTDLKYDSFGVIPIKAGIKEFFIPNIYFGIEAGVGLEITDSGWGQKKLDISPAVGYANKHWDIGVHYEDFSGEEDKYGLIGLRVAYGFGLYKSLRLTGNKG